MYTWDKVGEEWSLEMVIKAHRESEAIRKVCDGGRQG